MSAPYELYNIKKRTFPKSSICDIFLVNLLKKLTALHNNTYVKVNTHFINCQYQKNPMKITKARRNLYIASQNMPHTFYSLTGRTQSEAIASALEAIQKP